MLLLEVRIACFVVLGTVHSDTRDTLLTSYKRVKRLLVSYTPSNGVDTW